MQWITISLLLVIFGSLASGSKNPELVKEILESLQNITKSPDKFHPEVLSNQALASLHSFKNLNLFRQRKKEPVWPYFSIDCPTCEAGATLLSALFKAGTPLWEIEVAVISFCIVLDIEAVEVCEGMVHNYGYQVEYIFNNLAGEATPELVCGVFIGGSCGDQGAINDWVIDIPELPEKPPVANLDTPDNSVEQLTILQITDVHLDLSYLPGSPIQCGLPLCCMNSTGLAEEGELSAGYWGDYYCDLPKHTFEAMMEHIGNTHQHIDYVFYTGDSPAHDVWLQTKESNLAHQITALDIIREYLPEIPVFLTLGNHEGFPVNAFPTGAESNSIVSGDWLYGGLVVEPWADNLEEDAKETFRHNGFYSSLIMPGFRVIAINNNFCVGMNFFLMLDFSDPADQLSWLVAELLAAEEAEERVHILAHHPPNSCLPGWGREYTKIINRFQSTIKAQFHGHTHNDYFLVFHNQTGQPSTTAFVAPSATTFSNNNPEYRIYSVTKDESHESFGSVTDHETWSMDLSTLTGQEDVPIWKKLYSAKDDLGLGGVVASDWKDVLERARTDDGLFEKMVRYKNQDRESGLPDRHQFLCGMVWNVDCDMELY